MTPVNPASETMLEITAPDIDKAKVVAMDEIAARPNRRVTRWSQDEGATFGKIRIWFTKEIGQ